MRYGLPTGSGVKIITFLTLVLPLAVAISLYWLYSIDFFVIGVAVTLPIFVIFAIVYAYSPKEVILEIDRIVIRKVFGEVTIPYSRIKDVSYFGKLKWKTIRLFGSGGLFGWFGLFHITEIGEVWVYARRNKDMVLIKADKNYLLAPENPEDFMENLKVRLNKFEQAK
jgi:hypothetical protein